MVEIGVTEGGENTVSFHFGGRTQRGVPDNTNMKPQAKNQRFSKLYLKRNSS